MTPPLPSCKVSAVEVTDAELQQALTDIESMTPGQKKCKQAGLIGFMKKNPDQVAALAKGLEKDKVLAKFYIHQLRSSDARKTTTNDKGSTTKNSILKTLKWFSVEKGQDNDPSRKTLNAETPPKYK